jgi:uncharacterized protein (TIGR00159 family)
MGSFLTPLFIHIRILDIIDIFIVAFLLYQFYLLIRGTAAMNIFSGIVLLYVVWLVVKALNMELLGSILGQVIGVGVIALIILFQQEIRKFLLILGAKYTSKGKNAIESILGNKPSSKILIDTESISRACTNLSLTKTGALIVIARNSNLEVYAETGDLINANISARLLENIFFKNSPLHDGAVIIDNNMIVAARCVLPISENLNLPPHFGMRHKAALGLTEATDALVIIVSEETGKISIADNGRIDYDINPDELKHKLDLKLMNS